MCSSDLVIADRSLFDDKAIPGDGGFRGDGPAVDDGVATRIPLIGLSTEASKRVSESDDFVEEGN